jgi:hypothetical protein
MKLSVSFLGCLALPHAAGLSLRSGAAEAKPLGFDAEKLQFHELQLMLDRMSDCRADPGACADACANTTNTSDMIKNNTKNHITTTKKELDTILSDLAACKFDDGASFMPSFNDRVAKHTACRWRQVDADNLRTICLTVLGTQRTVMTTTCTSGGGGGKIIDKPPADLIGICQPSPGIDIGHWLDSMKSTFDAKYKQWQEEWRLCTVATDQVRNTTTRWRRGARHPRVFRLLVGEWFRRPVQCL